jgi:hypothetical protein
MSKFVKVGENKFLNVDHVVQVKVDGLPGAPGASSDDLEKLRVTLFVNGAADVKLRGAAALAVFEQVTGQSA